MTELLEQYLDHLDEDIKDSGRILLFAILVAVAAWVSGFFFGRLFP